MFGSESNGLSNDEISKADYILNIKTQNHYSSLNLSHAVLLVAYELSKLKQSQPSKSKLNIAKKINPDIILLDNKDIKEFIFNNINFIRIIIV